ncbi:hypothetical protein KCP71_04520 [Salmonella enterica subsp. enterica]|nr:hypothetical protein KCP71_04520 [Salmonella enterica subsp. enterica]
MTSQDADGAALIRPRFEAAKVICRLDKALRRHQRPEVGGKLNGMSHVARCSLSRQRFVPVWLYVERCREQCESSKLNNCVRS